MIESSTTSTSPLAPGPPIVARSARFGLTKISVDPPAAPAPDEEEDVAAAKSPLESRAPTTCPRQC